MRTFVNQITAFTLALSMTLSLFCSSAWAAELEPTAVTEAEEQDWSVQAPPAEEAPLWEEESKEIWLDLDSTPTEAAEEDHPAEEPMEEPTEEAPDTSLVEDVPQQDQEQEPDETESAPAEEVEEAFLAEEPDEEAAEAAEEAAEPAAEEETPRKSSSALTVSAASLSLEYDDRYNFAEKYPGYTLSLGEQTVTSYQVSKRTQSSAKDTAVLTLDGDASTSVIATGTGSATVTLSKGSKVVTVEVSVTPAELTLLFLAGQSNLEGSCSNLSDYKPQDSVLCPEGEVYSSYLPTEGTNFLRSTYVTGLKDFVVRHAGDEGAYIAGSLTGEQEGYPLYALTARGKGKTGPDSGLAYEWNRLTGEKVWVINAAVGNSTSDTWVQGGENHQRASKGFAAALKTAEAEQKAGHYTIRHKFLFWLQGEADWKGIVSTPAEYRSNFDSMNEGFRSLLGIEKTGLIAVRAHQGNDKTTGELDMNAVRVAQYSMALSQSFPNVFLVSNANEQWMTNSGVKKYFAAQDSNKDGKLDYPVHQNRFLALPTTVSAVHPKIHYKQVGHNENGLTAARGMYDVIQGKTTPASAQWRDKTGQSITTLSLKPGASAVAVMEVAPLSAAKNVTCQFDSSKLSYDPESGTLTARKKGSSSLNILSGKKTLATLTVNVTGLTVPTLKAPVNTKQGIQLTWSKVSGAKGYYVYRKTADGSYAKLGKATSASYVDTTAVNGTAYLYAVAAYAGSDLGDKSAEQTAVRLTSGKISSLTNGSGKKMTVKWTKNPKASGYEVQYALKSNFSDGVVKSYSGSGTLSKTLSGLKKGKTYYVRVRSYKTLSQEKYYSAWSDSKKVKIKK